MNAWAISNPDEKNSTKGNIRKITPTWDVQGIGFRKSYKHYKRYHINIVKIVIELGMKLISLE